MQSNGLATILLIIPVLTVPALAIFGIPQFAPVVASPLDEGQETGKETRVGNSARQSHDELFGDVEDFGSEPSAKADSLSKRRDTSPASANRRSGSRRTIEPSDSDWGDDVAGDSDAPKRSRRRPSSFETEPLPVQHSATGKTIPKKSLISERPAREGRRDLQKMNDDDAVRVASAIDMERGIEPAGFVDDTELERPQSSTSRSRVNRGGRMLNTAENTKRREPTTEPLSWQNAQERLNQLEIRNFRLEPSHQLGQFLFICSYTPPDNPRVSYRFEASADEPLKAVEKVLEQIVEWRQKR